MSTTFHRGAFRFDPDLWARMREQQARAGARSMTDFVLIVMREYVVRAEGGSIEAALTARVERLERLVRELAARTTNDSGSRRRDREHVPLQPMRGS